jgi:hypothetical protein
VALKYDFCPGAALSALVAAKRAPGTLTFDKRRRIGFLILSGYTTKSNGEMLR